MYAQNAKNTAFKEFEKQFIEEKSDERPSAGTCIECEKSVMMRRKFIRNAFYNTVKQ